MIIEPYLRETELLIGPLADWQGGGPESNALIIRSDGTPNTLRVKFSCTTQCQSTQTPTTIQIYNLSQNTRDSLRISETVVSLKVGWKNVKLAQIFKGALLAATHSREGADIVTTLISLPGYAAATRSIVSRTFAGGTTLTDMIKALGQSIPGAVVLLPNIKVKEIVLGNQGRSFACTAADALNDLSRVYGFSWTIEQGELIAVDDADFFDNAQAVVSTENGLLLHVEPMLVTPFQKVAGAVITSILHPSIRVNRSVKVNSKVNPKLSGTYKAHTVTHIGDTHSSPWQTTVESWKIGGV